MANPQNLTHAGRGRPKGAKNKPKTTEQIIAKMVANQLDDLLGKATSIIALDLDAMITEEVKDASGAVIDTREVPDAQLRRETAKFLLGRFGQPTKAKTYIEKKLKTKLREYGDMATLSKEAILLMMDGDMSFEQVEHLQRIITAHAGLQGYIEVENLREMLEQLAKMKTVEGNRVVPEVSQVTWGKGVQITHDGNETPAE